MSLEREILRAKAKKAYKEQAKGVPKKSRMTFAQFFKDYKKTKPSQEETPAEAIQEDFDLEKVINVDNNVAVEQQPHDLEVKEEEV